MFVPGLTWTRISGYFVPFCKPVTRLILRLKPRFCLACLLTLNLQRNAPINRTTICLELDKLLGREMRRYIHIRHPMVGLLRPSRQASLSQAKYGSWRTTLQVNSLYGNHAIKAVQLARKYLPACRAPIAYSINYSVVLAQWFSKWVVVLLWGGRCHDDTLFWAIRVGLQ